MLLTSTYNLLLATYYSLLTLTTYYLLLATVLPLLPTIHLALTTCHSLLPTTHDCLLPIGKQTVLPTLRTNGLCRHLPGIPCHTILISRVILPPTRPPITTTTLFRYILIVHASRLYPMCCCSGIRGTRRHTFHADGEWVHGMRGETGCSSPALTPTPTHSPRRFCGRLRQLPISNPTECTASITASPPPNPHAHTAVPRQR